MEKINVYSKLIIFHCPMSTHPFAQQLDYFEINLIDKNTHLTSITSVSWGGAFFNAI